MLKPLEKLELEEGEEVEIEVKKASVEEFHGKMRIDKEIADEIIEMERWESPLGLKLRKREKIRKRTLYIQRYNI